MKKNMQLLLIDPQKDFCHPQGHPSYEGTLCVEGALEDMNRVGDMIKRVGKGFSDIHITLDQHHKMDVAHPLWWKNSAGEHPNPFSLISATDVENGVWIPSITALRSRMLEYVKALEAGGRYPLCIWPEHCLIGTQGATVVDSINEATSDWISKTKYVVDFVAKGSNPFTEHYSGVQAEVVDPSDSTTQLNVKLIQSLEEADVILLAGEALSHCLANTVRDVANGFSSDDYVKKMVLLEDGSSSVTGFEQFGEDFIKEMTARGIQLAKTTDF